MIEPQDIQCSPEVSQCPNGQYVARAPELNCDFYPCPVMPSSTNSPSLAPVRQIVVENTFSPVVTVPLSPPSSIVESDQVEEEEEVYVIAEEGDEDERVATLVPTLKPVATAVWVDNDTIYDHLSNNDILLASDRGSVPPLAFFCIVLSAILDIWLIRIMGLIFVTVLPIVMQNVLAF